VNGKDYSITYNIFSKILNKIIKILALNDANLKIEKLIKWMHKKSVNMLTLMGVLFIDIDYMVLSSSLERI